jgi:hypothetical protein
MNKQRPEVPNLRNESDEADWWASPAGRAYVKRKSAESKSGGSETKGSSLVEKMNKTSSVQIAIRLPRADLDQARKLAERKGLGYQTLLKMILHEGLAREARRS